jgi:glucose-1-phosphate thymidylyltransferase
VIRDAIIKDSIINTGAQIQAVVLAGSLIGDQARVDGISHTLNIGDASDIRFG